MIGRKARLHKSCAVIHNENLCHAAWRDLFTNQKRFKETLLQHMPRLFGAEFALGAAALPVGYTNTIMQWLSV